MVRGRNTARKSLYVPTKSTCPVPLNHVSPERKTEFHLETGEPDLIEDRWTDKNVTLIEKPWTGHAQFLIDSAPKTSAPSLDRPVPSSSSSASKKAVDRPSRDLPVAVPDDSQDTKEPKDGDPLIDPPPTLPIALARIHKHLPKKRELLKLHMKHHHMSYEQLRHRTHSLRLPNETYEL